MRSREQAVAPWALCLAVLVSSGLGLLPAASAAADSYPSRPITLIVPFPPGGGNDLLARLVGERMGRTLGEPVVVENRSGAGGNIGSRQAARSAPDGYTVLLGFSGTLAINPALYANLGYDPDKDLLPIGTIATSPSVLVVNPAVPVRTLRDLIAYVKANPDKLNYASSGIGTVVHVSTEMLLDAAGIVVKHIPYKGTGPGVSDLLGGQVQVMMPPIPSVIGMIKDGRLRPIAVTSRQRSPLLPDVPTVDEAGLPGFAAELLYGLLVPEGTPAPIVARLNQELRAAVADDELDKRFIELGATPLGGTPADYAAAIAADRRLWGGIVHKLGLREE